MRTPAHRWALWSIANVLWFSAIPAHWFYLTRELEAGSFPVDADSIGIPFFGAAILVTALAPVLNLAWWWLSQRYPGSISLSVSNKSSWAGRLLLCLAVLLAFGALGELVAGAFELAFIVLCWSYVALAYRAVYLYGLHQRSLAA